MNELALFAGAGNGILGGKLLGWRTVCAVEINDYARRVLMARQDDGCFEPFPIWDDVTTFDGRPWCGLVDVISGGFPCQDISLDGKGAGLEGLRSGLWKQMRRIVGEVRPRYVLMENSPALTLRGLGTVLGDLAALGYDARWGVLGAHHAGAPHFRDRIWIVAHAQCVRRRESTDTPQAEGQPFHQAVGEEGPAIAGPSSEAGSRWGNSAAAGEHGQTRHSLVQGGERGAPAQSGGLAGHAMAQGEEPANRWYECEPGLARLADGMANRTHRLNCSGNGQVPAVVRLAWHLLSDTGTP